ncbi:MAG: inositol monophosphatase family protein [Leucobacter sp.]
MGNFEDSSSMNLGDLDVSPEELAELAKRIAESVGTRVQQLRAQGVNVAATKSTETDVVTLADREAERLITEALLEARPDDGLLGEEGASRESKTGITWVIDPIDGTVNYLYNIPLYAVSIAATIEDPHAFSDGRRPIAGAVNNPATGQLYHAWEGGGAYLNGSKISVSAPRDLSLSLIGTGFGYTAERRAEQAAVVAELLPQVRDIRRIGAAAYDLCQVAAGSLDGFYERGLHPWDFAAGALIAMEAGAAVLGRNADTRPGEEMIVLGSPGLAETLQQFLIDQESAN